MPLVPSSFSATRTNLRNLSEVQRRRQKVTGHLGGSENSWRARFLRVLFESNHVSDSVDVQRVRETHREGWSGFRTGAPYFAHGDLGSNVAGRSRLTVLDLARRW